MTRVNQETGELEFKGFARCSMTYKKDFTVGKWYVISDKGLFDDEQYLWGQFSHEYKNRLLYQRTPLAVINGYMSAFSVEFDEYVPTPNTSPIQNLSSTRKAKEIYNQFLSILHFLKSSNQFMTENQLRSSTDWICDLVVDEIITAMDYPESDFIYESLYEGFRQEETFQEVRDKIEGDTE